MVVGGAVFHLLSNHKPTLPSSCAVQHSPLFCDDMLWRGAGAGELQLVQAAGVTLSPLCVLSACCGEDGGNECVWGPQEGLCKCGLLCNPPGLPSSQRGYVTLAVPGGKGLVHLQPFPPMKGLTEGGPTAGGEEYL